MTAAVPKPDDKAPEKPAENGTPAAKAPGADWGAAIARVRDTNAWIVKAFVALAGVLVGSGPLLVKLGELPSTPRVLLAGVMALVALVGVGIVIHHATNVMLPQWVDPGDVLVAKSGALADLRKHFDANASFYLGDANKFASLVADYRSWRRSVVALTSMSAMGAPLPEDQRKALPTALGHARAQYAAVRARLDHLLDQALYVQVNDTFHRGRRRMYAGALLAAVGTAVYLGALGIDLGASEDKKDDDAAAAAAAIGTFEWHTDAAQPDLGAVRSALGLTDSTCSTVLATFTGTGAATDPWALTTLEGGTCAAPPVTFTIDSRYGTAAKPVARKVAIEPKVVREVDVPWVVAASAMAAFAGVGIGLVVRRKSG